jgi:hypothetical protein
VRALARKRTARGRSLTRSSCRARGADRGVEKRKIKPPAEAAELSAKVGGLRRRVCVLCSARLHLRRLQLRLGQPGNR